MEVTVMFEEVGPVPKNLLALAKGAAAPQLTRAALDRRFGPRSMWEPATGQIWRAVQENVTVLVLLLEVAADSVTVAPVTLEPIEGAADTLALDSADTSFGVPATVWAGLHWSLPLSVLDRPVDDVGTEEVRRVVDHAAWITKSAADADLRSTGFASEEARAALEDDMITLAEARAVDIRTASVASDSDLTSEIDLDALEPKALDEVAARLRVSLAVVLDLIDGRRPASPQQATVMREVLGGAPIAAPPPPGLVLEFTKPKWRGLVRQRRRRDHLTEAAACIALAYDVDAMAARQTGGQEPSWPDRISRWAAAHGVDPDADE
jgi:hypothetical protein